MTRYDPSIRVGAILCADEEEVKLLGYGTYAGDFVPPSDAEGFALELNRCGVENPRIDLDDGKVVWGCECWWGPEMSIRDLIGDRQVVQVDIDEERGKHRPLED